MQNLSFVKKILSSQSLKSKIEIPRDGRSKQKVTWDIWNSKVCQQDKFMRHWYQDENTFARPNVGQNHVSGKVASCVETSPAIKKYQSSKGDRTK